MEPDTEDFRPCWANAGKFIAKSKAARAKLQIFLFTFFTIAVAY